MKFSFLLVLIPLLSCSPTIDKPAPIQREKLNNETIELTVKTDLGADVQLKYNVYYRGQHDFNDTTSTLNQQLNAEIIDSLRQFSVYDMYYRKWEEMESIVRSIVENKFKQSKIKIERVKLWEVQIPQENVEIHSKNEDLKAQLLEDLSEVHEKYLSLEDKLETDKTLSKTERTKIKNDLLMLDNEIDAIRSKSKDYILE